MSKKFIINQFNDTSDFSQLTSIIFPIHYLFDGNINNNIGNTYSNVKNVIQEYRLDSFFNLIDNYTNVPVINHGTLFYKYTINGRKYLYYSNSGLGLEHNQIINNKNNPIHEDELHKFESLHKLSKQSEIKSLHKLSKQSEIKSLHKLSKQSEIKSLEFDENKIYKTITVAPKIYYYRDENFINFLLLLIQEFINHINLVHKNDKHLYVNVRLKSVKLFTLINFNKLNDDSIYNINININDYNYIIDTCLKNIIVETQNVCYALLNYFIYLFQDEIQECSFNHILTGDDNEQYKLEINKLSKIEHTLTLVDFFNNTKDYNKKINDKINLMSIDIKLSDELQNFNYFIYLFKEILKQRAKESHTLYFKLQYFNIEYNNLYGLCNSIQYSGSCSFYSYYNLGLNMIILYIYQQEKPINIKINELIDKFIDFHETMIRFFCMSLDIQNISEGYITYKIRSEYEFLRNNIFPINNYYNYCYIYKIICDNNLLDEINYIYGKDTFLFSTNTPLNQFCNLELTGDLIDNKIISKLSIKIPFNNLVNYLDTILFNIRNKEIIDNFDIIKDELHIIFNDIRRNLEHMFKDYVSQESFIDTIESIYIIYLKIIYKNYNF